MRWLVVALLVTSRIALAEPTLDEEIGRAALASKPLIVELYAEWCGPCHVFDEKVLTRADVKRALTSVAFVRYDIDRPIGGYVANRFNVNGVPAFIVLDGTGKELDRHLGGYSPTEFLALIAKLTGARTLTSRLEAAVIEHPDDMATRMKLAEHYLEKDKVDEANIQLALIIDGKDPQLAARPYSLRVQVDLEQQRVQAALDAALDIATRFPESTEASMAIATLGVTEHVDRERLHELVLKHLAVVPNESFDTAVRVAIITGHVPLARDRLAVRTLKNAALIDAEIALSSDREIAAEKTRIACREPGNDYACFLLEDALARRSQTTAVTSRMAMEARHAIASLKRNHPIDPPSYDGIEQLATAPLAFRDSVAAALRDVKRRCAEKADSNRWILVRVKLSGGSQQLMVKGEGELQSCVRTELRLTASVPPDITTDMIIPLRFELPQGERARPSSPIGERGVFAGLAMDLGNQVFTISSHGQRSLGFGPTNWYRFIVAGDLEVGASAYGFAYAARAYFGWAIALRSWVSISGVGGLGISDFGDELLPRAFTFPVEQRIRISAGGRQYHLWAREAFVLGDSVRKGGRDKWGAFDEYAVGIGNTLKNGTRQPLYLQLSFEKRVDSVAEVISLGAAFGSF